MHFAEQKHKLNFNEKETKPKTENPVNSFRETKLVRQLI